MQLYIIVILILVFVIVLAGIIGVIIYLNDHPSDQCKGVVCPTGSYCSNGTCLVTQCTTASQCPTGFLCNGTTCYQPCSSNSPCPPGFNCVNGQCIPNEVVVPFMVEGSTVYMYDTVHLTSNAVAPTQVLQSSVDYLGTSQIYTGYFPWTVHYNGAQGAVSSTNNIMPNYTFDLYSQFSGKTYSIQHGMAGPGVGLPQIITPNYLANSSVQPWSPANNYKVNGKQLGEVVNFQLANMSSNTFNLYASSATFNGFVHSIGFGTADQVYYYIDPKDTANTAPTAKEAEGRSVFVYYTSPQ